VDAEGNASDIPELLKQYVWKRPGTHLQALKEIVRALPIHPISIEWRDNIDGIINIPQDKIQSG
jgi:hypothetical protein